jgi:hypothetical protein
LQDNQSSPSPLPSEAAQMSKRKMYAAISAVAVIIILLASIIMVPPGQGKSMNLGLNYTVGESMVYQSTITLNQTAVNGILELQIGYLTGLGGTAHTNFTETLEVIGETSQYYTVNYTLWDRPETNLHLPALKLNVTKDSYYQNLLASDGYQIFYNYTSNPTLTAYLTSGSVAVGDYWILPINTNNPNQGLTGEITLTFTGFQDLTVPSGTYRVMHIEIQSNTLTVHSDNNTITPLPQGTLQFNGTTYLEDGTCRLIKADLTQATTMTSDGVERNTTTYTEKTLIQHTKP